MEKQRNRVRENDKSTDIAGANAAFLLTPETTCQNSPMSWIPIRFLQRRRIGFGTARRKQVSIALPGTNKQGILKCSLSIRF